MSNGRVFVTTAYEGSRSRLLQNLLAVAAVGLALIFCLSVVTKLRRAASRDGDLQELPRLTKLAAWFDALVVIGASSAFVLVAAVIAVRPEQFFTRGDPGPTWLIGGGMALIGLAAAFGWSKGDSRWRLLAVPVVLLGAVLLVYFKPTGLLGPTALWKRLVCVVPGVAVVIWYLINYMGMRRSAHSSRVEKVHGLFVAAPLLLLSALVFIPHNFLSGLQRVIVCLDLESGKILWERSAFTAPPEQKYRSSTYATPTPATDGEHVFAYFGAGIAGLDFDGRVLWYKKFPKYSRHSRYGAATSPILTQDSVIVVQEREASQGGPPSCIAAFDKQSGSRLWEINPPGARDSYTTPLLVRAGSKTQMLTASSKELVAYDPDSGERLWSHQYPMQQMVASMPRWGNLLAISGGAHGDKVLMVMKVAGERADAKAEVLWQSRKSVATEASPVIYDGKLFAVTRSGIMTCYDAETGALHWRERLDGEYYSSLAAGDGKIYASNTDGSTMVVAADSEFDLIAANDLGEPIYASPAISAGCLLIRTAQSLFCIQEELS